MREWIFTILLLLLLQLGFTSYNRIEFYNDNERLKLKADANSLPNIRARATDTRLASRPILLGKDRSRWVGDGFAKRVQSPDWFDDRIGSFNKLDDIHKSKS